MTYMVHVPHPDDQAALEVLVDAFIAHRKRYGASRRTLAAAVGVTHSSIYYLERRRPANPLIRTLQDYSAPIGLALHIDLSGLPELEPSPTVSALRSGGFLGTATAAYLRQVREYKNVTRKDLQAEHGWNWSSQAAFENSDREPLMSSVQRFARCLGGIATPRWEDL